MSLTFPTPCTAVSLLPAADAQIEAIAAAYEIETLDRPARPEAVRRLREAVVEALTAFTTGRTIRKPYPACYEEMAQPGEEWLLVHRYWFGYVRVGDEAVVFAVLDATSEMPAHR